MPFAAALSNRPSLTAAIEDVCQQINQSLNSTVPDLACVFVSHHYASRFEEIADQLQSALKAKTLLGCTGDSIVGGSQECEDVLLPAGVPCSRYKAVKEMFQDPYAQSRGLFSQINDVALIKSFICFNSLKYCRD